MIAYFDTSLLVGRYIAQEIGTVFAIQADEKYEEIVVSPLTILEAKNALRAACYRKEISESELETALSELEAEIEQGSLILYNEEGIFPTTDLISHEVIPSIGGRTLDTMHLAYAKLFSMKTFATADKRQAKAAEALGFQVDLVSID